MALITDVASNWSAPVTLSSNEVWQVRAGSAYFTTTASPVADDGLELFEKQAVQFSAGSVVQYRKSSDIDVVIVRETV